MKNVKKTLALAFALMMLLSMSACAKKYGVAKDWEYIQEKKTLVIGITEYEPMNYYADGKLVGFDTEFAEALCAKLGLTPEFVVIDWDSKELELSGNKIDCIWNGLTVTEDRKANMDFTISYLKNQQVVVVRASELDAYTSAADFDGKTVAAEEGSAGAAAIETDLTGATLLGVAAQSDALLELKAGKVDAAVIDLTMAQAMTGENSDCADLIMADIDMSDEEYAIGLRVGSNATEQFNSAIGELLADGTLNALAEKYALTDLLIG